MNGIDWIGCDRDKIWSGIRIDRRQWCAITTKFIKRVNRYLSRFNSQRACPIDQMYLYILYILLDLWHNLLICWYLRPFSSLPDKTHSTNNFIRYFGCRIFCESRGSILEKVGKHQKVFLYCLCQMAKGLSRWWHSFIVQQICIENATLVIFQLHDTHLLGALIEERDSPRWVTASLETRSPL